MPASKATATRNLIQSAAAPRCQHIRLNGQRCAAPARSGAKWCVFHAGDYEGHLPTTGIPEDAATIQIELARVIRQLQDQQIEPRSAALILYALQIASMNLKRLNLELPAADTATDDLIGDLYRRIDPLPQNASQTIFALQDAVAIAKGLGAPRDPESSAPPESAR